MSEAAAESIFGSVGWFWAEWERRVGVSIRANLNEWLKKRENNVGEVRTGF